jgi:hypothetical protein
VGWNRALGGVLSGTRRLVGSGISCGVAAGDAVEWPHGILVSPGMLVSRPSQIRKSSPPSSKHWIPPISTGNDDPLESCRRNGGKLRRGVNEDAIFLFVRNDVIEVIYGDDGPVIFMYKMKYILYMIVLKSINDPIN